MVSLETLEAPRPMIGCKQDAILTSDELMESFAVVVLSSGRIHRASRRLMTEIRRAVA